MERLVRFIADFYCLLKLGIDICKLFSYSAEMRSLVYRHSDSMSVIGLTLPCAQRHLLVDPFRLPIRLSHALLRTGGTKPVAVGIYFAVKGIAVCQ